jgi:AraC-like DNA-binding protein
VQKIKLTAGDREALENIKKLIEGNMEEMPSLRQLCKKSGLNEDKLKKGFKLLYGLPLYAYHCHLKIERAKKLLQETDQSVCEIAWQLGYEQSSGFCKTFKKITGMTALEWRDNQIFPGDS